MPPPPATTRISPRRWKTRRIPSGDQAGSAATPPNCAGVNGPWPAPSALTVVILDAQVQPPQSGSKPQTSPGWAVQWYVVWTNAIIVPALDWTSSEARGPGGPSG